MSSFSIDPSQLFGFAEVVRSWLPWQWRPSVTPWLILSGSCFILCLVFVVVHVLAREKPIVDWQFYKTGTPLSIGMQWNEGIATSYVEGIQLGGENISGHALHQIDGEVTLLRTGQKLPLFAIIQAQWMPADQIESVPPKAILSLGGQFRGDGLHWPEFPTRMRPSDFLREFGAFSVSINIDGDKKTWSFTMDELRDQVDRQVREQEDHWLANPMNRAQIPRKGSRF